MKKKTLFIPLAGALIALLISCNVSEKTEQTIEDLTTRDTSRAINENVFLTESITYDVEIKNKDATDHFKDECLQHFNRSEFVELVFELVYSGKLEAYDIFTGEKMTVDDVKEIEKAEDYDRHNIGKIQFEESWTFDPEQLTFEKKVNMIKIGYEKINSDGSIRGYGPVFALKLN